MRPRDVLDKLVPTSGACSNPHEGSALLVKACFDEPRTLSDLCLAAVKFTPERALAFFTVTPPLLVGLRNCSAIEDCVDAAIGLSRRFLTPSAKEETTTAAIQFLGLIGVLLLRAKKNEVAKPIIEQIVNLKITPTKVKAAESRIEVLAGIFLAEPTAVAPVELETVTKGLGKAPAVVRARIHALSALAVRQKVSAEAAADRVAITLSLPTESFEHSREVADEGIRLIIGLLKQHPVWPRYVEEVSTVWTEPHEAGQLGKLLDLLVVCLNAAGGPKALRALSLMMSECVSDSEFPGFAVRPFVHRVAVALRLRHESGGLLGLRTVHGFKACCTLISRGLAQVRSNIIVRAECHAVLVALGSNSRVECRGPAGPHGQFATHEEAVLTAGTPTAFDPPLGGGYLEPVLRHSLNELPQLLLYLGKEVIRTESTCLGPDLTSKLINPLSQNPAHLTVGRGIVDLTLASTLKLCCYRSPKAWTAAMRSLSELFMSELEILVERCQLVKRRDCDIWETNVGEVTSGVDTRVDDDFLSGETMTAALVKIAGINIPIKNKTKEDMAKEELLRQTVIRHRIDVLNTKILTVSSIVARMVQAHEGLAKEFIGRLARALIALIRPSSPQNHVATIVLRYLILNVPRDIPSPSRLSLLNGTLATCGIIPKEERAEAMQSAMNAMRETQPPLSIESNELILPFVYSIISNAGDNPEFIQPALRLVVDFLKHGGRLNGDLLVRCIDKILDFSIAEPDCQAVRKQDEVVAVSNGTMELVVALCSNERSFTHTVAAPLLVACLRPGVHLKRAALKSILMADGVRLDDIALPLSLYIKDSDDEVMVLAEALRKRCGPPIDDSLVEGIALLSHKRLTVRLAARNALAEVLLESSERLSISKRLVECYYEAEDAWEPLRRKIDAENAAAARGEAQFASSGKSTADLMQDAAAEGPSLAKLGIITVLSAILATDFFSVTADAISLLLDFYVGESARPEFQKSEWSDLANELNKFARLITKRGIGNYQKMFEGAVEKLSSVECDSDQVFEYRGPQILARIIGGERPPTVPECRAETAAVLLLSLIEFQTNNVEIHWTTFRALLTDANSTARLLERVRPVLASAVRLLYKKSKLNAVDETASVLHELEEASEGRRNDKPPQPNVRRALACLVAGLILGDSVLLYEKIEGTVIPWIESFDKQPWKAESALFLLKEMSKQGGRLFEMFLLPVLRHLFQCCSSGSNVIKTSASETCRAVLESLSPHGVRVLLPGILTTAEERDWRLARGAIDFLGNVVFMGHKQVAKTLPICAPVIIKQVHSIHSPLRAAAIAALEQISRVVNNPEVHAIRATLVKAITEIDGSALGEALLALSSTRFEHAVDAPSLAISLPILERTLIADNTQQKKTAIRIIQMLVASVRSPADLSPYWARLRERLQICLAASQPDVRSAVAKAFGRIAKTLPKAEFYPVVDWLLDQLETSKDITMKAGAAQALAEVIAANGKPWFHELLPKLITKMKDIEDSSCEGYIGIWVFLPSLMRHEVADDLPQVLPHILLGMNSNNVKVKEMGTRAAECIVRAYGSQNMALILKPIDDGCFSPDPTTRSSSVRLLGCLLDEVIRVGNMSAEGQHMGNVMQRETLALERRQYLLASLYVLRCDTDAEVRTVAGHAWKEMVDNSVSVVREILGTVCARLINLFGSGNATMCNTAKRCVAEVTRKLHSRLPSELIPLAESYLSRKASHAKAGRVGAMSALRHFVDHAGVEILSQFLDSLFPLICDALGDEPEVSKCALDVLAALWHYGSASPEVQQAVPKMIKGVIDAPSWTLTDYNVSKRSKVDGIVALAKMRPEAVDEHVTALFSDGVEGPKDFARLGLFNVFWICKKSVSIEDFKSAVTLCVSYLDSKHNGLAEMGAEIISNCLRSFEGSMYPRLLEVLLNEIESDEQTPLLMPPVIELLASEDIVNNDAACKKTWYYLLNMMSLQARAAANQGLLVALESWNKDTFQYELIKAFGATLALDTTTNISPEVVAAAMAVLTHILNQREDQERREAAAESVKALIGASRLANIHGSSLVRAVAPIIRHAMDRTNDSVRLTIVETLVAILEDNKDRAESVRAVVPQIFSVIVRALNESLPDLQLRALEASELLMVAYGFRVDALFAEILKCNIPANDEAATRRLRNVLYCGLETDKIKPDQIEAGRALLRELAKADN